MFEMRKKEVIKARGCNKRLKSPRILNSLLQKEQEERRGQLEEGVLFLYDKYAQITLVDCKLTQYLPKAESSLDLILLICIIDTSYSQIRTRRESRDIDGGEAQ